MSNLPKVRIEIGESAIFTRVYIDGVELHGVTRLWFDSGDIQGGDGPRKAYRDTTRIHLEFLPQELVVDGVAETDLLEMTPVYAARKVPA